MGEIGVDAVGPPVYHFFVFEERVDDCAVEFPKWAHESDGWNFVSNVAGNDGVAEIENLS